MKPPFQMRRPLAVAAAALSTASLWAAQGDEQELVSFVTQQIHAGARGVVMGEDHRHVGLPQRLGDQVLNLQREAGLGTLYTEGYSANKQPLLDRALQGEAAAQRQLYADFAARHDGQRNLTARYNLLFKSRQAGLRVMALDSAVTDMPQFITPQGQMKPSRIIAGDMQMSRIIQENDDGRPFMAIVGELHTATAPTTVYDEETAQPVKLPGGVPPRLAERGLSTTVLNLSPAPKQAGWPTFLPLVAPAPAASSPATVRRVYEWALPPERADNQSPNRFARAHGLLRFQRELVPTPTTEPVAEQLEQKFMRCAAPAAVKAAALKYMALYQPYLAAPLSPGEQSRQAMAKYNLQRLKADVTSPHFAAAQRELCSKKGEKLWRRAMP